MDAERVKPLTMTQEQESMVREWGIGFREAPDEMPERAVSWVIAELDATRAKFAALTESHAACVRALRCCPILVREPGEFARPWLATDKVGTDFGLWDAWYEKRNAALSDPLSLAVEDK
jgi:hypothetical protein